MYVLEEEWPRTQQNIGNTVGSQNHLLRRIEENVPLNPSLLKYLEIPEVSGTTKLPEAMTLF